MTEQQLKLVEKHGTPEQFEEAVWNAYDTLFITEMEATTAIDHYKREWKKAGKKVEFLYDADPKCKHKIVIKWSGIMCTKCKGWFCY